MRRLLCIDKDEEYTGFFSLQFLRSLNNRCVSLSRVIERVLDSSLNSLVDFIHAAEEMTRIIEHAFSTARSLAGAMPNALQFISCTWQG